MLTHLLVTLSFFVSVSDDERLTMYEDFANTFRGEKTLQACLIEDLKVSRLYFIVFFAGIKSYQCKKMAFTSCLISNVDHYCYVVVYRSFLQVCQDYDVKAFRYIISSIYKKVSFRGVY